MANIDQRVLGKGFPEEITLRNVDAEFVNMENFIGQRINSELAMEKRKPRVKEFINNPWVVAIGTGLILLLLGYFFS